jgi:hypothetical protein
MRVEDTGSASVSFGFHVCRSAAEQIAAHDLRSGPSTQSRSLNHPFREMFLDARRNRRFRSVFDVGVAVTLHALAFAISGDLHTAYAMETVLFTFVVFLVSGSAFGDKSALLRRTLERGVALLTMAVSSIGLNAFKPANNFDTAIMWLEAGWSALAFTVCAIALVGLWGIHGRHLHRYRRVVDALHGLTVRVGLVAFGVAALLVFLGSSDPQLTKPTALIVFVAMARATPVREVSHMPKLKMR